MEHISLNLSKFVSSRLFRIKSIIGISFTVNKAFGMPSDKGLSLVASPQLVNIMYYSSTKRLTNSLKSALISRLIIEFQILSA